MTFSSKLSVTTAALAALGLAAAHPAAAQTNITLTSQSIASASDVLVNGTLVGAYAFGHPGDQTVNGVLFQSVGGGQVGNNTGNGNLNVTTFDSEGQGAYGSASAPYSTLTSSSYKALLGSGLYDTPNPTDTAFFQLAGLTVGNVYETQFFVSDSRGSGTGRNETLTLGANTVTLTFNTASAEGGLGQYAVGTFTADATTAQLAAKGNISTQVNGFQYRDLGAPASAAPEPSQLAGLGLAAFGVLGLLFRARKRTSISAAAPTVWGS